MQTKYEKMLKGIMIQRDLTRQQLAEQARLSVRTIHNVFCGSNKARRTIAKLEFALQLSITCTPGELQQRLIIAQELGADPGSISLRDLRKRAKVFGVRITRRSRSEIINAIAAKLTER